MHPAGEPALARPGTPGGPDRPGGPGLDTAPRRSPRRRGRLVLAALALLLIAVLAWPVGLLIWANGRIQRTEALSSAADTPGTTYLLTGSDARDDTVAADGTEGSRTDTIMLLHVPDSGPSALISLPRDTYVEIPGHGPGKLNAASTYGGAPLLVSTVESLSGLTVDHYVEVGFSGVSTMVDALGGVELCLDYDVPLDVNSGLTWTAGCHLTEGPMAVSFSRMRYSDPQGDIGRAERQRQLIAKVAQKAEDPSLLLRPRDQVALIDAALGVITVDERTGIVDLGRLALAFRNANGPEGISGTPPIADPDYRPGRVGSTVLLDPDATPAFFQDVRDGSLAPGVVGGLG